MRILFCLIIIGLMQSCKNSRKEDCGNLTKLDFLKQVRVEIFPDKSYGHYIMLNECSDNQSIRIISELKKYIRLSKYKPVTEIYLMKYNTEKYEYEFANNINDDIAKNMICSFNIQKSEGDSIIVEKTYVYLNGEPFNLTD